MAIKAKEQGREGKLAEISFRPAEGGAISEARMAYPRGGQGGGADMDYDHEIAVHPSLDHAVKHLKAKLGPHFNEAAAEPAGAAEGEGSWSQGEGY